MEQNARMALRVANRGYVLQTGQIVLSQTAESLRANEMVRQAYLGITWRAFFPQLEPQTCHDEDDGQLQQALQATELGVTHAQPRDLLGIRRRRQQLLEDTNLIRQE